MPVPPAGGAARLRGPQVPRGGRTGVGHVPQDGVDLLAPPVAPPLGPARPHPRLLPRELQPPHRVEPHRNDGGVVGPVLERRAVARHQMVQRLGPIAPSPGPQDHVMGPRQGADAVHLHEAEIVQHAAEVRPPADARLGPQQQVAVQEQTSGASIVETGAGHPRTIPAQGGGDRPRGAFPSPPPRTKAHAGSWGAVEARAASRPASSRRRPPAP